LIKLLSSTERLLLHVEHDVPLEVEVLEELKKLIADIRRERDLPDPVAKSLDGTPST